MFRKTPKCVSSPNHSGLFPFQTARISFLPRFHSLRLFSLPKNAVSWLLSAIAGRLTSSPRQIIRHSKNQVSRFSVNSLALSSQASLVNVIGRTGLFLAIASLLSCHEPEIDLSGEATASQSHRSPSGSNTPLPEGPISKGQNQPGAKSSSGRDASAPRRISHAPYIFMNASQLNEAWVAGDFQATQELFTDWLSKDQAAAVSYLLENVDSKDAIHYSPSIKAALSEMKTDAAVSVLSLRGQKRALYQYRGKALDRARTQSARSSPISPLQHPG